MFRFVVLDLPHIGLAVLAIALVAMLYLINRDLRMLVQMVVDLKEEVVITGMVSRARNDRDDEEDEEDESAGSASSRASSKDGVQRQRPASDRGSRNEIAVCRRRGLGEGVASIAQMEAECGDKGEALGDVGRGSSTEAVREVRGHSDDGSEGGHGAGGAHEGGALVDAAIPDTGTSRASPSR